MTTLMTLTTSLRLGPGDPRVGHRRRVHCIQSSHPSGGLTSTSQTKLGPLSVLAKELGAMMVPPCRAPSLPSGSGALNTEDTLCLSTLGGHLGPSHPTAAGSELPPFGGRQYTIPQVPPRCLASPSSNIPMARGILTILRGRESIAFHIGRPSRTRNFDGIYSRHKKAMENRKIASAIFSRGGLVVVRPPLPGRYIAARAY